MLITDFKREYNIYLMNAAWELTTAEILMFIKGLSHNSVFLFALKQDKQHKVIPVVNNPKDVAALFRRR